MHFIKSGKKHRLALRLIAVALSLLFVLATLAAVLSTTVTAEESEKLLRVGLKFGSSSVSSLALTSSSGFEIGTFDRQTEIFTPSLTHSGTALVASTANGSALISTPERNAVCSLYANTPVCIRAADGQSIYAGSYLYSGIIEITLTDNGLKVVNITDLEDYVKGVVVSEVYSGWPAEALKSQAIVARSFTLYNSSKHASDDFDICANAHCQAYRGIAAAVEATNKAVDDTKGLIVSYNGKPALTVYYSSSGQRTESASNAWGSRPEAYPYLASVDTGFDDTENYRNGRWSYTVSASALTEYINSKPAYAGILKGNVESIVCEKGVNSDYVRKITVADAFGNEIVVENSASVRSFINQYCKSACFTISSFCPIYANYEECMIDTQNMYVITADGTMTLSAPTSGLGVLTANGMKTVKSTTGERVFTISGVGYGHGVGMSQYGAMTLAEQGYDYNYILGLYYPGTTITTVAATKSQ